MAGHAPTPFCIGWLHTDISITFYFLAITTYINKREFFLLHCYKIDWFSHQCDLSTPACIRLVFLANSMIPFGSDFTIPVAGLSISVILLIWKIWKYWWAVKMYTKAQGEFYPGINGNTHVLIWKVVKILQVTVQKKLPSVGCSWTLFFCSSEIAAASVTFCIDILRPTAIFRKSIVAEVYCNPSWRKGK